MTNHSRETLKRTQKVWQLSETLHVLVDVLIPGDSLFPPASQVGVQHALAERLRAHQSEDAIDRLVTTLSIERRAFTRLSPQERVRAVRRLERTDPGLFAFIRTATYFAYYQHPLVVRAIRQLGYEYNDAPQPRGYAMPPFDPALDAPSHQRGFYKKTEDVSRVDTSSLDEMLSGLPRYPSQSHH